MWAASLAIFSRTASAATLAGVERVVWASSETTYGLPLTRNPLISKALGTRHRAAIGLAERSDAVVIVVSEETGKISVVADGSINYDVDISSLRKTLKKLLESRQSGWLQ